MHLKQLQSYANDVEHDGCRTLHSGTFPAYMKMRNGFYLFMKTLLRTCELSVNFFARPVCPSHPLKFLRIPTALSYLFSVRAVRRRRHDDDQGGGGRHEEGELGHVAAAAVLVEVPQGRSSRLLLLRSFDGSGLSSLGPSIPGCSDSEGGAWTAGGP